jgi:hypothetical protein
MPHMITTSIPPIISGNVARSIMIYPPFLPKLAKTRTIFAASILLRYLLQMNQSRRAREDFFM